MSSTNSKAIDMSTDMLGSVSRTARTHLLLTSTVGWFMVLTKVVPAKLSIFGLEFPNLSSTILLGTLAGIILFQLIAFCIYMIPDYLKYRHAVDAFKYSMAIDDLNSRVGPPDEEDDELSSETNYRADYMPTRWGRVVAVLRTFFDFVFPVLYGVISVGVVAYKAFET